MIYIPGKIVCHVLCFPYLNKYPNQTILEGVFIKKRRLRSLNCCEVPSAESSQTDLKQTQREKPPKLSFNLHPKEGGGVEAREAFEFIGVIVLKYCWGGL